MSRVMFVALIVFSAQLQAAGLSYTAPPGWKGAPTSSSMRVAQFTIPRAAGDAADADVVVYYFGGSGGTIEANIERWVGQMRQPDGKPSSSVMRRESRTINGLKATLVDVSGTYVAEITPGSTQRHNSPGLKFTP